MAGIQSMDKTIRRAAAIYDIHGNLPALNAVLVELEQAQPDAVIVGGDIVSGPMPGETLERLLSLGDRIRWIRGNGDRDVVSAFDGSPMPPTLSESGRRVTEWAARRLTRLQRDFLDQLPERVTLPVEGLGDVLFCHATPHSDEEIFTQKTPQERLAGLFAGVSEPVVVCGHTHIQFELRVNRTRVLNAGSVGMPYADRPGAYWLLLGPEGREFRRTVYDLESAAKEIKTSGYPAAQKFVEENVLTVPTAAEAAELFERMAQETDRRPKNSRDGHEADR